MSVIISFYGRMQNNQQLFLYYYKARKKGSGDFNYTMTDFEDLRHYPEAYKEFLEDYMSVVVGKNEFKRKSKVMKLSSFVTVSDEAFALLTVKNNEEVWPVKANNSMLEVGEQQEEEPKTRYTNRRRLCGSPRDGWTKAGLKQFVDYYKLVIENRKSDKGQDFECVYLNICKKDDGRTTLEIGSDDDVRISSEDVVIPTDWDTDVENVERALLQRND